MNKNKSKHLHKSIRLKEYDYSIPWWYFVTICTHNQRSIFGRVVAGKMNLNALGKIVEEELLRTKEVRKNVELDYYVIMPNHIHIIVIIDRKDTARCVPTDGYRRFGKMIPDSLPVIIRSFKSAVTIRINELGKNQVHLYGSATIRSYSSK